MPCLLFDISNLAYRSFHAAQASAERMAREHGGEPRLLQTRDGFPTGVLHNSYRTILNLIEEYKASRAIAVFDHGPCIARTSVLPTYKANRPPRPPELARQMEDLYEHLPLFGIPVVRTPNTEADDIIHVLARMAPYDRVIIVGDDKDMGQCISDKILQLKSPCTSGDQWRLCSQSDIEGKMGIKVTQVSDFLALTGDSSDNIPGLPGVGEVKARGWLNQYGSIEGIIAAAHEIEPKRFRPIIQEHAELLRGYHSITKLHDVNVAFPPHIEADPEKRDAYLAMRELRSVAARFKGKPKVAHVEPPLEEEATLEKPVNIPERVLASETQGMLF